MWRWLPAGLLLVALSVLAGLVASWFGAMSAPALVSYGLVIVGPGLWLGGAWLWDALSRGFDRLLSRGDFGGLIAKIESGEAPLPFGTVEVSWDEEGLKVAGGGRAVTIPWCARPMVRAEGDRVLVIPWARGGVPDAGRAAIIRIEAFGDIILPEAFGDADDLARAVEEWSARSRG